MEFPHYCCSLYYSVVKTLVLSYTAKISMDNSNMLTSPVIVLPLKLLPHTMVGPGRKFLMDGDAVRCLF